MTPDPTPQPDHGAAGFCGNHANSKVAPSSAKTWSNTPDERVEIVARVLHDAHWRSTWAARSSLTPTACRSCMAEAATVVAALDDETARLRQDQIRRDDARRDAILALGEANADLAAARAALDRVRALGDEWARDDAEHLATFGQHHPASLSTLEVMLRAALDPEEPR